MKPKTKKLLTKISKGILTFVIAFITAPIESFLCHIPRNRWEWKEFELKWLEKLKILIG